ncbi:MAG TPA: copper transporter [Actinomycetota bacterium]|nr:copper transporter [Actinomycetota bacterium]
MISLRQHVVTIVAIFLALALGVLAGSAFVQPRLIESLETQVDEQRQRITDLQDEVGQLGDQLAAEQAFNDAALPHLTRNRLIGLDAVVLSQEGVEDEVVAETRGALEEAGATVVVLEARSTLAPQDEEGQAALAEVLTLTETTPEDLSRLAAETLAERLASEERRDPPDPGLLHLLLTDGYLASLDASLSDETLATIGGPDQMVVVLAGGDDPEAVMAPEDFAVPLVERLADLGLPVAAGESVDTAVPFVPLLRDGGTDGVVTVDDLDESRGGAALVLGLERLLLTGQGGDYGVKGGAAPLPPAP